VALLLTLGDFLSKSRKFENKKPFCPSFSPFFWSIIF